VSLFLMLQGDDPRLTGNWYSFPPPAKGTYDLRRVQTVDGGMRFQYFANKRVYEGGQSRLLCMGRRVTRMRLEDGWQFRFPQGYSNCVPVNWRPMAVIYEFALQEGPVTSGVMPRVLEKRDITGQLPLARSIDEARHIIRLIPERWPVFRGIHVEYTEEKLQS
jgi:hypothetical protein